jgi:hypothetical protein
VGGAWGPRAWLGVAGRSGWPVRCAAHVRGSGPSTRPSRGAIEPISRRYRGAIEVRDTPPGWVNCLAVTPAPVGAVELPCIRRDAGMASPPWWRWCLGILWTEAGVDAGNTFRLGPAANGRAEPAPRRPGSGRAGARAGYEPDAQQPGTSGRQHGNGGRGATLGPPAGWSGQ